MMMADDEDETSEVDDLKEGKVAAIRSFRKALDAGDDEAAAEALYRFNSLCEEYRAEKSESDEKPKKGGLAALIIGEPKDKG